MVKYYAGIGSRKPPHRVYELMVNIGYVLAPEYVLRTGGAEGSDTAFAIGCGMGDGGKVNYYPNTNIPVWAYATVDRYHPAPHKLTEYARKCHARNAMIILGNGAYPVEFVICWTYNACGAGGTGQGIRIARAYNIPVYDLGNKHVYEAIKKRVIELQDGDYQSIIKGV